MTNSYQTRSDYFKNVSEEKWCNWIWQQQNAVRNISKLQKVFPHLSLKYLKLAEEWQKRGFRFLITPYVISLIKKDHKGNPQKNDPIFRQVFPIFEELLNPSTKLSPDEYSPNKENWEVKEEMLTPIAQHKYDNRAVIYLADSCLGYCLFCFRSLQSNANSEKHGGKIYFQKTIEALKRKTKIEEVILSGGDPLIFDNKNLEDILKQIRAIKHIKAIRFHTRAWMHNPFRIDNEFCQLLKKYQVTEIGVHIIHPNELTEDFQNSITRIRNSGARTLLLSDTPLIKEINDNKKTLHKLFIDLYTSGIKPYYLSHNMPNIPAAKTQRTSVKKGVKIMNSLKRHISNPAMPEYMIMHKTGKRTIPDLITGTTDFVYTKSKSGHPIIKFKDWKGKWQIYLDAPD